MEEKQKPRRWLMWLVVGLILLVAYPLSFGPAYWMMVRTGYHPAFGAFDIVYHPLVMLASRDATVGNWAAWYLTLGQSEWNEIGFVSDTIFEGYSYDGPLGL